MKYWLLNYIIFSSLINWNALMKKKCPSSRLLGYPEAWFIWERQDKCLLSPLSLPVLKVNWCVHSTLPWPVNHVVTTQDIHTEAESAGLQVGHGDVWEKKYEEGKWKQWNGGVVLVEVVLEGCSKEGPLEIWGHLGRSFVIWRDSYKWYLWKRQDHGGYEDQPKCKVARMQWGVQNAVRSGRNGG